MEHQFTGDIFIPEFVHTPPRDRVSGRSAGIVPPAVNTDLGGKGLHTFGAPLDDFADSVMQVPFLYSGSD